MIIELLPYFLLPAIFLTIATIFLKRKSSRNLLLPPGPRSLPVLGNLLDLGENPHLSLACLARIHGPVMFLKLGRIHTVVISSPSSAKEVLVTKANSMSSRKIPDCIQSCGHHKVSMAWSPPDQLWRYLRTLMKTHLMSTESLDANQLFRQQKVQELVAYIKGQKGDIVRIGLAAFCTVLNLISTTFMSIDMVNFKSESAQEFKDLMWGLMEEAGRPNISDFFPLLAPFDLQGRRRRFTAYYKKLHVFFHRIIEHRLAARATAVEGRGMNDDILGALLQLSQEDDSKLSKETIIAFLVDSFVAGSETSSTTLEWAMAELLHQPELLARAREEIVNFIGIEKEIEESDISRLPFIQAVIKETLRLHPPAPLLLPHKAEANTEINGYFVPKNTQVIVNVWAIGRDERVWSNPNLFEPERFIGGGSEIDFRGRHFELTPFGSGRRICPGLPLGVRMVQLMLASLIQSFEWSLPNGMAPQDLDLREKFGLTLVMASPLEAMANPITKF